MSRKITFTTLILLSTFLMQFAVAPQKVLAASCDAAQFVADITIPDGRSFNAGETFTKTWRLKNVGTCTWTKDYSLVFDSSNQMGATSPTAFPNQNVAPGQTVDLSVNMTAPNISGIVFGYWKLKNANGAIFGIGAAADKAFWVEIKVNTATTGAGTVYDFVQNAASSSTVWTSGAGTLPFPGTTADGNGAGLQVDSPKLENGTTSSMAGLLMVPEHVTNGFVQAQYPPFHVQSGDHFQSIVNCEFNATACYVNFRLDYQIGSGPVQIFWSFNERYEGLFYPADRDLTSLAGQDVKFILRVGAAGFATGDRALWVGPRITRGGVVPTAMPTITGTPPTPTKTPIPNNGADRATFIADVNVPDGTVYNANTTFTKTWRIKNTGTSTWTTAFRLVYVSGDRIGGPDEVPLTATIAPNTSYDFSVTLISPAANGSYKGFWMLKNAGGVPFGIGSKADQPWWVQIVVTGGSNVTPMPTVTGTPPTPTATSPGPSKTPTPNTGPDRATFISETVLDGTTFGPNTPFTKTWTIKNTGTSTWTTAYKLVFVSGNQMGNTTEVPLASPVSPNATVDLLVNLTSPATGGTYRSYWMLKNASGALFGIGSTANRPFWVDIFVSGAGSMTATVTPGPSLTPMPTAQTSNWLTYTNQKYQFQFQYPLEGQISGQTDTAAHIALPILKNTNLADKSLDVNVAENATTCTSPLTSGLTPGSFSSTQVSINGISFIKESGSDAGAGQIHQWTAYSTIKGSTCISLSFVLHSSNPGNFSTPPPVFNEAAESAVFADIVSTFKWLPYGVVGVTPPDGLNVRSGPDTANPTVVPSPGLAYNANNIIRTGASSTVSGVEWWEIQKPGGGTGWVNSLYLTEYVPSATFCADSKVATLLADLGNALKNSDGTRLAALVSPKHGVDIRLVTNNKPVNYTPTTAATIFASTTSQNWGAAASSGQIINGTFKDVMLPKLLDVYNNPNFKLTCNDTTKVGPISQPWPLEYTNINFYSVYKPATTAGGQDWRDFLVGIEYVNGQPYLFALIHFEWGT